MANTEAESVDDMVAASSSEGMSGKWMLVQLMPESHQMKRPVKRVVSRTPRVERAIPGFSTGLMSAKLVSIPPVKRMMLRATMPMNWAAFMSWNWMPRPSLPKSMPTNRKSSRVGTPKR